MCGCLLHTPYWAPGPQPWDVPCPGITPATLWFTGWCLVHWATPARVRSFEASIYKDTLFKCWFKCLPLAQCYQMILAKLAFPQPSLFSNCTLFFLYGIIIASHYILFMFIFCFLDKKEFYESRGLILFTTVFSVPRQGQSEIHRQQNRYQMFSERLKDGLTWSTC